MVFRTDIFRKLSLGAPDTWLSQIWSKVFSSNNMQLWVTKYCWALSLTTRYSNDNTKCYPIKQCIGMTNTKTEQNFNPGSKLIVLEPDPWSVNNIDVNYLIIHWINCCCCCWLFVESVMGPEHGYQRCFAELLTAVKLHLRRRLKSRKQEIICDNFMTLVSFFFS